MIHRITRAALLSAALGTTAPVWGSVLPTTLSVRFVDLLAGCYVYQSGATLCTPLSQEVQGPLAILFPGLSSNPNSTSAAALVECRLPNGGRKNIIYRSAGKIGNPTGGWGDVPERLMRLVSSLGPITLTTNDLTPGDGCEGPDDGRVVVLAPGKVCGAFDNCTAGIRTAIWGPVQLQVTEACSVTATDINIGGLAAGEVEGATGASTVIVTCTSPSTVRVTAKGQLGGEDVNFGAGVLMRGGLKVNGVAGPTGAVVQGGAGGTAVQVTVQMSDISGGNMPAGLYNGMAVITVTPE